MTGHDLIVIGASAGGVEALQQLIRTLPSDLPAAIAIVLHVPPYSKSVLPEILVRVGKLPAHHVQHEMRIQPGTIYIAPPNQHLLVKDGIFTIARGPHENGHRPAVDPLFRTAARAYGPRVIGVILSGVLDDGTAGLLAVKTRGGIAVVQDPKDAMYDGMPRSAVENVDVDYVVPLKEMGELLVRLVHEPAPQQPVLPMSEEMEMEADMAELDTDAMQDPDRPGTPSGFVCPDCGGTLYELHNGDLIHYRCRIGHAFAPETLLAAHADRLEDAFWVALRALEESAALSRRLAERVAKRGHHNSVTRFEEQAVAAEAHAELVREVLLHGILTRKNGQEQPQQDDISSASDTI